MLNLSECNMLFSISNSDTFFILKNVKKGIKNLKYNYFGLALKLGRHFTENFLVNSQKWDLFYNVIDFL